MYVTYLIQIECASAEEDGLVVYVDDTRYKCNMEGEELSVVSQRKKFNHYGIIICPSYKKVCLKLTAPEYPGDVELWVIAFLTPLSNGYHMEKKTPQLSWMRTVDEDGWRDVSRTWLVMTVLDGEDVSAPYAPMGANRTEGEQLRLAVLYGRHHRLQSYAFNRASSLQKIV
ncbi:hypothetical protein LSAT2_005631 [Lamellibrachia satsuma]|nr:hypothetical protein LSAT2_005631 [Lamellibrachia satsuma]